MTREKEQPSFPLIFLAFDEAHPLTSVVASEDGSRYSNFSLLRRVLRLMHGSPIFSFFMSTTGKISQFTPAPNVDVSTRIMEDQCYVIPPFVALGFDQLMEGHQVLDGSHTLDEIARDEFMVQFGRPL